MAHARHRTSALPGSGLLAMGGHREAWLVCPGPFRAMIAPLPQIAVPQHFGLLTLYLDSSSLTRSMWVSHNKLTLAITVLSHVLIKKIVWSHVFGRELSLVAWDQPDSASVPRRQLLSPTSSFHLSLFFYHYKPLSDHTIHRLSCSFVWIRLHLGGTLVTSLGP